MRPAPARRGAGGGVLWRGFVEVPLQGHGRLCDGLLSRERAGKLLAREGGAVVDRSLLEWAGAEEPRVLGLAGDFAIAALPDRLAAHAVVGKHGDLADRLLIGALGQRDFGNRGRPHRQHAGGGQIGGRNAQQHVLTIGSQRAGAHFDDVVGLFRLVVNDAARGQHVLAERADDVVLVERGHDIPRVEVDVATGQRAKVDFADGAIDRVGDQQLLGGGTRRVRPLGRAAARGEAQSTPVSNVARCHDSVRFMPLETEFESVGEKLPVRGGGL